MIEQESCIRLALMQQLILKTSSILAGSQRTFPNLNFCKQYLSNAEVFTLYATKMFKVHDP